LAVIAKNLSDPQTVQTQPRQARQVSQVLTASLRGKKRLGLGVSFTKSVAHFRPDFKSLRPNARAQPCQDVAAHQGGNCKFVCESAWQRCQQLFEHPHPALPRQTAPTRVGCCHPLACGITQQDRQTIGHHDGAGHRWTCRDARIGGCAIRCVRVQRHIVDAVHLLQKNGAAVQRRLQ
jgi:hypothetical protein